MKGLLYKDLILLLRDARTMLFIALVFLIVGSVSDNHFFTIFSIFYIAILPITTMGIDETTHWDRYAITMPVVRRDLVASRYIWGLLAMVLAVAFCLIIKVLTSLVIGNSVLFGENVFILVSAACVSVIYLAVNLPVLFKLGVARGRLFYILLTGMLFAAIFFWIKFFDAPAITNFIATIPLWSIPVICLLIYFVSFLCSVKLYSQKEL